MITSLDEKKGGRRRLEGECILFIEAIEDMRLVDIISGEDIFTWNNKRGGEHLVASWLDRFLVSEMIVHSMGEIMVDVLLTAGSDHWPICLNWDWSSSKLGKPFRFKQFWMEHKEFKKRVMQWWQEPVPPPGTFMYRFQ